MLRLLIISLAFSAASMTISCDRFEQHLNRSLEEEESYTRHAMEYHREHPDKRPRDSVLDTWSKADYIALAVARRKQGGEWAELSDRLPFLQDNLKLDSAGQQFCVIQTADNVVVLRYLRHSNDCTLEMITRLNLSSIHSGDMEFSGRTDYWIYVTKRPVER